MNKIFYRVEVMSMKKTGQKLQDVLFTSYDRAEMFVGEHNNDNEFTLQFEYNGRDGVYTEIDTPEK